MEFLINESDVAHPQPNYKRIDNRKGFPCELGGFLAMSSHTMPWNL